MRLRLLRTETLRVHERVSSVSCKGRKQVLTSKHQPVSPSRLTRPHSYCPIDSSIASHGEGEKEEKGRWLKGKCKGPMNATNEKAAAHDIVGAAAPSTTPPRFFSTPTSFSSQGIPAGHCCSELTCSRCT